MILGFHRRDRRESDAVAARLQGLPKEPVPPEVARRARVRVLAAVPTAPMRRSFAPRVALAAAVAALLALGTTATLAAPDALPGDPLYGVKRAEEQAKLMLARNPAEVEQLRAQQATARAWEAQALQARQRAGERAPAATPGRRAPENSHAHRK